MTQEETLQGALSKMSYADLAALVREIAIPMSKEGAPKSLRKLFNAADMELSIRTAHLLDLTVA